MILIAAVSEDGFISTGSGVPWDLPEDREHFRRLTRGQWLLLGRRTFDEMRGWLHRDHHPLVLTSRPLPAPWECAGIAGVEEAIARAGAGGAGELWVCGGASVYERAMPVADELILTEVRDRLGGGVRFPKIDPDEWIVTRREPGGGGTGPAFAWVWYRRRSVNGAGVAQGVV